MKKENKNYEKDNLKKSFNKEYNIFNKDNKINYDNKNKINDNKEIFKEKIGKYNYHQKENIIK